MIVTILSFAISFAALIAAMIQTQRYALVRTTLVMFALGAGNIHVATVALTAMLFVNHGFRPPQIRLQRTELITCALVGMIIAISMFSPITIRTVTKLLHLGLFIFILFQLLHELKSPERIQHYLKAMVFAGTIVSLLGFVLPVVGLTEAPHIFLDRGSNEASIYLSMFGTLAGLTLFLWERKLLYLLPCLLMAAAQFIAGARSNNVLAAVMFAGAGFFYFDNRGIKALMLAAALGVFYWARDMVGLAFEGQVNFSALERIELTRYGWELWLQRPYTGWGWGSTSILVPQASLVQLEYPHFHNTWVQLLAEVGVVGCLLIAGFVWFSLRCIWISLFQARSPAVAAYVSLAAIGITWLGFFEALTFGADRVIMLLFVLPLMGYMTMIAQKARAASGQTQASPVEQPAPVGGR